MIAPPLLGKWEKAGKLGWKRTTSRSCANLSIMRILLFRQTSSNGSRTQSFHRRRLYSPHRRVARRSMSAAWACRPCSELVSIGSCEFDVHQTRHSRTASGRTSSTFSDPRGRLRAAQSPATNDQAASFTGQPLIVSSPSRTETRTVSPSLMAPAKICSASGS